MKKIILIAVSGLLFLTSGWFLGDKYKNNKSSNVAADVKDKELTILLEEKNRLQKEIEYIKADQQKKYEGIAVKEEKPSKSMGLSDDSVSYDQNEVPNEMKETEEPRAKIITQLPKKYAEESVNEVWAIEQERKLQKLFAEATEFQDKELRSIKCKTSTCEIKFYAEDKSSQLKIGSDIGRFIMSKYSEDFEANIMSTYSDSEKTASYYFSSKGN